MCLRAIWSGFPTQIRADREVHHLSPFAGTEKTKNKTLFIFAKTQYLNSVGPRACRPTGISGITASLFEKKARLLIKTFLCGSGEGGGGTGIESLDIIAAVHCCPLIFYIVV